MLNVYAQPRASKDAILGPDEHGLRIRIQAPPVDNVANKRLIELLARGFGVAKSKVIVQRGATSRGKQVRIQSPTQIPPSLQEYVNLNAG